MRVVKHIFRYIKGILFHDLTFHRGSNLHLLAYLDVDCVAYVSTWRFITSSCIFLGCNLICWSSKKQVVMSRSSAKSKYHALVDVIADVRWSSNLLQELDIPLHLSLLLLCTWLPILCFMLAFGISTCSHLAYQHWFAFHSWVGCLWGCSTLICLPMTYLVSAFSPCVFNYNSMSFHLWGSEK